MISPHTRNPTSHAAIHEPFQSEMIRPVWFVVVGVDGGHPVSRWAPHPESSRVPPNPPPTTAARRPEPRTARTTSCERTSGLPHACRPGGGAPGAEHLERVEHYRVVTPD